MPLFSATELSSIRILEKGAVGTAEGKIFDIFLSHSYDDRNYVEPMKQILEDIGYRVYVDWIFDRQLDRSKVTPETADLLRKRMMQSKSLLYLVSKNSCDSQWMQWELGYSDGQKGKVAILPISKSSHSENAYNGLEYLGLYPYIFHELNMKDLKIRLKNNQVVNFKDWLNGPDELKEAFQKYWRLING